MIREAFYGSVFFLRRKLVLYFLNLYQKCLDFIVNFHQQCCWSYLLRVQKKQTKQVSFCKLSFFMKIAEYELVKIGRLTEVFPAGYSNLRSTCTENYFDGNQCFDKRFSSRALPESEREPVGLSGNLFNIVVKTAFYISKRSFWRLCIDLKSRNNWIFATIDQKIFSPLAKIFVRGSKTVFYVFRRKCWSNMTFWRKQSSSFLVV